MSIGVQGVLVVSMLVTAAVTPLVTTAVLSSYRRAVVRSMNVTRGASDGQKGADSPNRKNARPRTSSVPVAAPIRVIDARVADVHPVRSRTAWLRARARAGDNAMVYTIGGAVFALVAGIAWRAAGDVAVSLPGLVPVVLLLGWPALPTWVTVASPRPATVLAVWACYLLAAVLPTGSVLPAGEAVELVAVFVLPPAVALLAVSGRRMRAVGPFLAVPVFGATTALLLGPWLAARLMLAEVPLVVAVGVALAVGAVLAAAGLAYLMWCADRYVRRRVSDEMVLVAQRWFLVAGWCSLLLLPRSPLTAVGIWVGYLGLRVVCAVGLRAAGPATAPVRLLLLRTFGTPRRGESLLRLLGTSWRYVGPVQMIAGPDLVSAGLEPHEFLDRVRGRLSRRFVGDGADLAVRVRELDPTPDPDGRYRVHELFCHADTWRAALVELVHRSDVVLVDLREFDGNRAGVDHEIRQLLRLVPLDRVAALVDPTTDETLLRSVLDDAWRGLSAGSPNAVLPSPWTMLRLPAGGEPDPAVLLWVLTRALPDRTPSPT
jgi:hypothetical protein